MAVATVSLNLLGTLSDMMPILFEFSFFHIYSALVVGFAAGFCEEIIFRGYVMDRLKKAGQGKWIQVLGSSLTFGFAHAGTILFVSSGSGNWMIGLSNLIMFMILGAIYGGVYLMSNRSLMPVIAAHFLNDFFVIPLAILKAYQVGM